MKKRFFAVGLLLCLAVLPGRGEDGALSKLYRSFNTFGNHVRNTFTEDAGDSAPGTQQHSGARHRKHGTRHLTSKKAPAKDSDSPDESSNPKSESSKRAAKTKSAAASSKKARENDSQATAEQGEPGSRPMPVSTPAGNAAGSDNTTEHATPMATLKPEALREFRGQPLEVQRLIRNALALTERNLSYKYGSADPAEGGMDCSGFIYYV